MEILIIVLGCVAGFAGVIAFACLASAEWHAAAIAGGICLSAGLLTFGLNGMLVDRNKTPVYDGGQVTAIVQTLDHGATIYRTSFDNVSFSKAVVCEDGESLKCTDLKLGDTIVFQKWANDGWNWRFRPLERR